MTRADGSNGALACVTPEPAFDPGDGDNDSALCLGSDAPVSGVSFPAGLLTDPREDANPATTVALSASRR